MRIVRLSACLILAFLAIYLEAQSQDPPQDSKITVTGELSRAMAIGGESTGWAIQFDSETSIGGKQVSSIEIEYRKTKKLEKLENQRVTVVGVLSQRRGVETGERNVLVVSTIKRAKTAARKRAAEGY